MIEWGKWLIEQDFSKRISNSLKKRILLHSFNFFPLNKCDFQVEAISTNHLCWDEGVFPFYLCFCFKASNFSRNRLYFRSNQNRSVLWFYTVTTTWKVTFILKTHSRSDYFIPANSYPNQIWNLTLNLCRPLLSPTCGTNVGSCRIKGNNFSSLGSASSLSFFESKTNSFNSKWFKENGSVFAHLDDGEKETFIQLICSESDTPLLSFVAELPSLKYHFNLSSSYACPSCGSFRMVLFITMIGNTNDCGTCIQEGCRWEDTKQVDSDEDGVQLMEFVYLHGIPVALLMWMMQKSVPIDSGRRCSLSSYVLEEWLWWLYWE